MNITIRKSTKSVHNTATIKPSAFNRLSNNLTGLTMVEQDSGALISIDGTVKELLLLAKQLEAQAALINVGS